MDHVENSYIYIRQHESYDTYNCCKLGSTINLASRDNTYSTGEYVRGIFTHVYRVNIKNPEIIERILQHEFRDYKMTSTGGTEFYNILISKKIPDVLIQYNFRYVELNQREITFLLHIYPLQKIFRKNKTLMEKFKTNIKKIVEEREKKKEKEKGQKWDLRDYQKQIIQYIDNLLLTHNRSYLELATGAGKSYIIYNLFKLKNPETIVIYSPRININIQNTKDDYLKILDNKYYVYNNSIDKDFKAFYNKCKRYNKKIIIIACPQNSNCKIYDLIIKYDLQDIFIWFDEAHHTIEGWVNSTDITKRFFLENNERIKYRIFTSASPEKTEVHKYPDIFGELYSPIKVFKLIEDCWLAPIIPHIFGMRSNNVSISKYITNHFEKFERKNGFSFHNKRINAFNLFVEHYEKYKSDSTKIKPFLLVGNEFQHDGLNNIDLKYDYRDIRTFEKAKNSIAYVVQQYSMGYDFEGIDYIVFSDPKMSASDIIQSIGRGTRPDKLGENGKNLKKNLDVMLPVYIGEDSNNKSVYDRITAVLRYLILDINIPFDKIDIKCNYSSNNKQLTGKEYEGEDDVKAVFLDLLKGGQYSAWKYKDFTELLRNNKIHNRENDYEKFLKNRPELNLPDDPYRCFPDFRWELTYCDKGNFYNKEYCKKKINEIKESDCYDFDEIENIPEFLNKLDPKIPNMPLFRFYGGVNNNEFY